MGYLLEGQLDDLQLVRRRERRAEGQTCWWNSESWTTLKVELYSSSPAPYRISNLICCRVSTAEAKQASLVLGWTYTQTQDVFTKFHSRPSKKWCRKKKKKSTFCFSPCAVMLTGQNFLQKQKCWWTWLDRQYHIIYECLCRFIYVCAYIHSLLYTEKSEKSEVGLLVKTQHTVPVHVVFFLLVQSIQREERRVETRQQDGQEQGWAADHTPAEVKLWR